MDEATANPLTLPLRGLRWHADYITQPTTTDQRELSDAEIHPLTID